MQNHLKAAVKSAFFVISVLSFTNVHAGAFEEIEFNQSFLPKGMDVDLDQFKHGNPLVPGSYRVKLTMNNKTVGQETIQVVKESELSKAQLCIPAGMLEGYGVDLEHLTVEQKANKCPDVADLIPNAAAEFDIGELNVKLSIPQKFIAENSNTEAQERLWDHGINAAFVSYDLNGTSVDSESSDTRQSFYAGLNTGVNINGWRFRHASNYSRQQGLEAEYQSLQTYVQHDVTSWKGQVQVGQINSKALVGEQAPISGISLFSDERMLPYSQRNYAPVISGTALSNARVVVTQKGYTVYERRVAPGEFAFDDIVATYSADFVVSIYEDNGQVRSFVVPYTLAPTLLRQGRLRYSVAAGETRFDSLEQQQNLFQASMQYGATNSFTVNAGAMIAEHYQSIGYGSAFNTSFGAWAVEMLHSKTDYDDMELSGKSVEFSYNKSLAESSTSFSASYRQALDESFRTLQQSQQEFHFSQINPLSYYTGPDNERKRLTLSVNQSLADYGNLSFSWTKSSDWQGSGGRTQYQARYSKSFNGIALHASAGRNQVGENQTENTVALSVSIPIDALGTNRRTLLHSQLNQRDDRVSAEARVSGSISENNAHSYGIAVRRDEHDQVSFSTNLIRQGSAQTQSVFVSGNESSKQISLGGRGTVLLSGQGIALSGQQGTTMALLSAKGAGGSEVDGSSNQRLDSDGLGLVTTLVPYTAAAVSIDSTKSKQDVQLLTTSKTIVPRDGAVVLVEFETNTNKAIYLRALFDKQPIPFAATVHLPDGALVGSVGQGSMLYARVPEGVAEISVKWGDTQTCQITLRQNMEDFSTQHCEL